MKLLINYIHVSFTHARVTQNLWGGEKREYIFYHALVGSSRAIFHLKYLNVVPWENVLF